MRFRMSYLQITLYHSEGDGSWSSTFRLNVVRHTPYNCNQICALSVSGIIDITKDEELEYQWRCFDFDKNFNIILFYELQEACKGRKR